MTSMTRSFSKTVLITGASRGIGAAAALACAAQGWDVAVNCTRDEAAAQAVAAQVRALGRRAIVVVADVADEAAVLAMFARVDADHGARLCRVVRRGSAKMAPVAMHNRPRFAPSP